MYAITNSCVGCYLCIYFFSSFAWQILFSLKNIMGIGIWSMWRAHCFVKFKAHCCSVWSHYSFRERIGEMKRIWGGGREKVMAKQMESFLGIALFMSCLLSDRKLYLIWHQWNAIHMQRQQIKSLSFPLCLMNNIIHIIQKVKLSFPSQIVKIQNLTLISVIPLCFMLFVWSFL